MNYDYPHRRDAQKVDTSTPDIESSSYWRRQIIASRPLARELWDPNNRKGLQLTKTQQALADWARVNDPRSYRRA